MKRDAWKAKWEKIETIGQGGQGFTSKVRRAGDTSSPLYVLKQLKNQTDNERRARICKEVATLGIIDHPQIAKLIDSNADDFKKDEELYLIMDFMPGPDLRKYIDHHLPDIVTAATIVDGLLSTLAYCHQKNIVHRDIKPENIIIRNNDAGDVVLLDFGLSFNDDTQVAGFETDSNQHLGNRFIILPEYGVRAADKRSKVSDLTQCVGILFFLVTGHNPEHLNDEQGRPPHERPDSVERLNKYSPEITAQLRRIFDMGFSQRLLQRFQSTTALCTEIRKLESPPPKNRPSFEEELEKAKQRIIETPMNLVSDRVTELASFVGVEFNGIWTLFLQKLAGILINPGNFPRQSNPSILWFDCKQFTTKYDQKERFLVGFFLRRDEDELCLGAANLPRQSPPIPPFNPAVANEIARFGIFDPDAKSIISTAIKEFLLANVLSSLEQTK